MTVSLLRLKNAVMMHVIILNNKLTGVMQVLQDIYHGFMITLNQQKAVEGFTKSEFTSPQKVVRIWGWGVHA